MNKIHLFTNSEKIVKIINSLFSIKYIFTEKKNFNLINKKKFKIKKINSINQITNKYFKNIDKGISFGFSKIFKKEFISRYPHGIWNIHPGDLPKYRGRHPITWAFLNNEKKIGLSIHIINEKIDQGFLLAKKYVKRNFEDDEKTILNKICNIMGSALSLAISNYKKKNY